MLEIEIMIYLIRHATPDFNRHDLVYYLPPGPPLTSKGVQEAEEVAEFLKGVGIARVYTSPLERCLQTARTIEQAVGLASATEPGLAEIRRGESEAELLARVWPVWEKVVRECQSEGGAAALVTHGAPVNVLLKALGVEEAILSRYHSTFDYTNPLPPAGIWKAALPLGSERWELALVFMPSGVSILI